MDQTPSIDEAVTTGIVATVKARFQHLQSEQSKTMFCATNCRLAAQHGQLEVVKFLVEAMPNQSVRNQCCIEALQSAAIKGHLEVVQFLVQAIADHQNVIDQCCMNAALSAASEDHLEVVKYFYLRLKMDTRIETEDFRFRCTLAACSRLRENVVSEFGLEPDWLFQFSPILSFTAAMAIEGRNSVLTDTLSRMQPAQVTQLLRVAISQRHVALAVTLINDERFSSEHVDQSDSTGATALMLAADAGHHELIEKLLDLGASVSAEDSQGRTALSRACEAGHVRAAKALMDRGADASHRDGRGLTCAQLAERLEQREVLRLLDPSRLICSETQQAAATRDSVLLQWVSFLLVRQRVLSSSFAVSCIGILPHRPTDSSQRYRQLSEELHQLLSEAGFTKERANCQQTLAHWLKGVAEVLTRDDRQITGSYAEGWANSLAQVNGRTAADSDIDWTVLVAGQEFHLEGGCNRSRSSCRDATKLIVKEGHAQVAVGAGSQPAVTARACGVRPAQDTCYAIWCCSSFCDDMIRKILKYFRDVHLVRATRPNSTNELRVSFGFQEKEIMADLGTVQGQLFTMIKFIFKRHLPHTLDTPGLKTYHAKTLLFFMLEKNGTDPSAEAWQPQNLIARLLESLDMMLNFISSRNSPDECMPHFFMPDAPLYFKNAGIGGDFDNTKARVRNRLNEMRSDINGVVEQLKRLVRPLQSESFYFHPFTLLPLTAPPAATKIREGTSYPDMHYKFADVYSVVHQCVSELQLESSNRDTLMRQLSLLNEQQWCKCAALCLTAMSHLKFGEVEEAEKLAMELQKTRVKCGLSPKEVGTLCSLDCDWAWRFCLPCDSPPRFPFLPEFTQTLLTARLSQPLSSHLYVNFRCLSWSLQAELLQAFQPIAFDVWLEELQEDPDLEELLTLARYSDCREHVELSLRLMETIKDERRVAMETQDEEKIRWVKEKLESIHL
ncbi:hypothetical protein BOX15_Mlig031178g1 [Macrostomum lignano]|uniref:Mab-21-like HhH/H2TH-like domain-containing protein n=1 Tax=Macrostomum lignano TaxID=282301 RepID=A0A267H246_9PLAT|nr:hypothetical protein BOX15_Mlig031178g1 [Macrostomum lignano]